MSKTQTIAIKVWGLVDINIPVGGIARALENVVENASGDERVKAALSQARTAMFYGKCATVCLCIYLVSKSLLILHDFGKIHPLPYLQATELAHVIVLANPTYSPIISPTGSKIAYHAGNDLQYCCPLCISLHQL